MSKLCLVTLLSVLTIERALQAQGTPPAEPGTIQGIVTRAGTIEPLSGAQVTLQGGAFDPQAMQVLLNTAASQGIVVTPAPGASTSDIIQAMADAAAARGFPLTTANLQSQLASLSGKTPPTTTTDREGVFTFKDIAAGSYTVRVQKEGFFGKPEGGVYPPTAAIDVRVLPKETVNANLSMGPSNKCCGGQPQIGILFLLRQKKQVKSKRGRIHPPVRHYEEAVREDAHGVGSGSQVF